MADTKKTPLYIYNEPATYNQFNGGINSDPSNENLLINELRKAVNIHYASQTPTKRPGAVKHMEMLYDEDILNVQGIFLLTIEKTYIFVAADGKLYYSLYFPNAKINLKRLRIHLEDQEDLITNQMLGLPEYNNLVSDADHEGYIYNNQTQKELIFQNTRKIESITHNDKLYIATGTRFIKVELIDKNLKANIIKPYLPNGMEYQNIGLNLLSPYPEYCVNTRQMNAVKTQIHFVRVKQIDFDEFLFEAVMTYANGVEPSDYYFKWEKINRAGVSTPLLNYPNEIYLFNSSLGTETIPISKGKDKIVLRRQDFEEMTIRCTFAKNFKEVLNDDTGSFDKVTEEINFKSGENDVTLHDWVPDNITSELSGAATATPPLTQQTELNHVWATIHSCNKIISDGNKFILYGDKYKSGQWFKTIINNPEYITYRGGLNFKTNKNEELLKVIQFKGIILAFAYSEHVGGNISIVLGDGEDYNDGSGTFSPYMKRIVNTNISTDNADTVQVVDNMIIFKHQTNIYMIEGSELNNEIISVQSLNSKVKIKNKDINIPWEDNTCISEVTEDYYALIWDELRTIENKEIYIIRPAMRVKMYYKMGYYDGNVMYFPWLIDEGRYFNTSHIIYIDGVSTHLFHNLLLQYKENVFTDYDNEYEAIIKPRGVDANYPKFKKFLSNALVYYYRGPKQNLDFYIRIYNEAGYLLLEEHVKDSPVLHEGQKITSGTILGSSILESKVFNVVHRFPALLFDLEIKINNKSDFSLGSITYNYVAINTPDQTQSLEYKKIIRVGEPMIINKTSFAVKEPREGSEEISVISGGGAEDFK